MMAGSLSSRSVSTTLSRLLITSKLRPSQIAVNFLVSLRQTGSFRQLAVVSANPIVSNNSRLDEIKGTFSQLEQRENFNRIGAKVKPIFVGEKRLICELFLEAEHLNSKGTIHGGLTASLTDIITAQCLGLSVNTGMASVELAVSYLLPAKMGDTLEITATVLKCGKNMAFTEAEFRRKSDGKLCARGKHSLALLPNAPSINAI